MGIFELRGRPLITVILAVAGIDFLLVGVCVSKFRLPLSNNHSLLYHSMIKDYLAAFSPVQDLPQCWVNVSYSNRYSAIRIQVKY